MPGHDIIVIGGSAGGIEALSEVLTRLPRNIPAAIFVVIHIPAQSTSMLPAILGRAGTLPVFHALDGARIEYGHIYVAPPDNHLLLEAGQMRVVRGPRENRHRPAIDPLFRSAALTYGSRVVGVVLSGSLDDGTAGLLAIKRQGGIAVVQDPKEALYSGMPRNAVENVEVDHVLPLAKISGTLVQLAQTEVVEGAIPVSEEMEKENRISELEPRQLHGDKQPGTPSVFSCPECGGVLWEVREGQLLHFRCRVGHAFSSGSMLAEQAEALEEALWTALKTLEEQATLSRRLAEQSHERGQHLAAQRFEKRAQEAIAKAETLRQVLLTEDNLDEFDGASLDQSAAPEPE